jgi:hypothetical protein
MPLEFSALIRLAGDIALRPGLSDLLPATPGVRTWISLEVPEGVDAWLIAWPEGTDTGWHDDQGSAGVFAVADGALTEFSIANTRLGHAVVPGDIAAGWPDIRSRRIIAGDTRRFGSQHIHHVVNETSRTAYSAHVYAPRLRGMSNNEWRDDDLVLTDLAAAGTWQG